MVLKGGVGYNSDSVGPAFTCSGYSHVLATAMYYYASLFAVLILHLSRSAAADENETEGWRALDIKINSPRFLDSQSQKNDRPGPATN
jgi:hypothetical protein